jgi:hypothetical protein
MASALRGYAAKCRRTYGNAASKGEYCPQVQSVTLSKSHWITELDDTRTLYSSRLDLIA